MFTINIEKECGCFKRSDLQNHMSFDSKDDALIEAKQMESQMNETFCKKHNFTTVEDGNSFKIMVEMKSQPQAHSHGGGCCGGGHCG